MTLEQAQRLSTWVDDIVGPILAAVFVVGECLFVGRLIVWVALGV